MGKKRFIKRRQFFFGITRKRENTKVFPFLEKFYYGTKDPDVLKFPGQWPEKFKMILR